MVQPDCFQVDARHEVETGALPCPEQGSTGAAAGALVGARVVVVVVVVGARVVVVVVVGARVVVVVGA